MKTTTMRLFLDEQPIEVEILDVDDDGQITFDYMTSDNQPLTEEQEQEIANQIVLATAKEFEAAGHKVEYTKE